MLLEHGAAAAGAGPCTLGAPQACPTACPVVCTCLCPMNECCCTPHLMPALLLPSPLAAVCSRSSTPTLFAPPLLSTFSVPVSARHRLPRPTPLSCNLMTQGAQANRCTARYTCTGEQCESGLLINPVTWPVVWGRPAALVKAAIVVCTCWLGRGGLGRACMGQERCPQSNKEGGLAGEEQGHLWGLKGGELPSHPSVHAGGDWLGQPAEPSGAGGRARVSGSRRCVALISRLCNGPTVHPAPSKPAGWPSKLAR